MTADTKDQAAGRQGEVSVNGARDWASIGLISAVHVISALLGLALTTVSLPIGFYTKYGAGSPCYQRGMIFGALVCYMFSNRQVGETSVMRQSKWRDLVISALYFVVALFGVPLYFNIRISTQVFLILELLASHFSQTRSAGRTFMEIGLTACVSMAMAQRIANDWAKLKSLDIFYSACAALSMRYYAKYFFRDVIDSNTRSSVVSFYAVSVGVLGIIKNLNVPFSKWFTNTSAVAFISGIGLTILPMWWINYSSLLITTYASLYGMILTVIVFAATQTGIFDESPFSGSSMMECVTSMILMGDTLALNLVNRGNQIWTP